MDESLAKIAKGAGLAFIGALAALLLGFVSRILIARYVTEAEYGVFSLALAILSICAAIAALGLHQGVSRSIAYARGKGDQEKIRGFISASILFALIASLILCFVLLFTSDTIAEEIFHEPALGLPLKIFAAAIPFFVLLNVLPSIFRGFDQVKPQVYFQNILTSALPPLLLLPIIFLDLPFTGVFYAYLASFGVSCIALILYATKRLPSPIKLVPRAIANPIAKELFLFSVPLLGIVIIELTLNWTDILMLGYFKTSGEVGLYNAARPLARLISLPLLAMLAIYMPVASGLYAQGLISEMRRNFSIVTKWLCSASLPLFLILFLFPETVLSLLFGTSYAPAANVLRLLSLGFIIDTFLGPNGNTLIAMGKVRFLIWATLATAVVNIGLNIALIPPLGIEGAAIAFMAAISSFNLIKCWKLYSLSKAQPLSKNLIKPMLASLGLIFLIQFIFGNFVTIVWWMLPLLFILYYGIYGLAILFTKSFDQEDIAMLLAVEKRAGINATFIKRILQRFL